METCSRLSHSQKPLHPEARLPCRYQVCHCPHSPIFPQVSWATSIISLCRPSSAPGIPCAVLRKSKEGWEELSPQFLLILVLGFYLPPSLSSFETVGHHFSLHFPETTVSSVLPLLLWSLLQAAWKALTHLPLNVIIPPTLVFDLTFFFSSHLNGLVHFLS